MEDFNAINAIGEYIWDRGLALAISAIVVWGLYKGVAIVVKYAQMKVLMNHDGLLDRRHVIDSKIQQLIDQTLYRLDGERILVMEFHNSSKNLSLLPWANMTCNYETFKPGVLPAANTLKQISASLFSVFLTELQKDYVIIDEENRDSHIGRSAFALLLLQDESSALSVLLRDTQNKPVGYITLKKSAKFSATDISTMQNIAGQIGALLCATNSIDKKGGKITNGKK